MRPEDWKQEIHRAFLCCFTDDHGQLTPEAKILFATLEHDFFANRSTAQVTREGGGIDPYQMAYNEGKRMALRRIRERLQQAME